MRGSRELWIVGGVSAVVAIGILAVGLIPFNRSPTQPGLDRETTVLLAQGGVTLAPPFDKQTPELVTEANRHGVPAALTEGLVSWTPATPGVTRGSAESTVGAIWRGQSVPSTTALAYASSSAPLRFRVGAGFVSRNCNRAGSCVVGSATCAASGAGCLVAGGRLAHRLTWVVAGDGVGPWAGRRTAYLVDAQSGQLLAGFQS